MGFKIGDKVVCIKTDVDALTIKNMEYILSNVYNGYWGLTFEFEGLPNAGDGWVGFKPERFRKVEPKKATICATASILREFKESEIIKEVDVIEKPNPVYV